MKHALLIASAIVLSLVSLSCSRLNDKFGLPDDNLIEQFFEWVIDNKTGIDVDLTPEN